MKLLEIVEVNKKLYKMKKLFLYYIFVHICMS